VKCSEVLSNRVSNIIRIYTVYCLCKCVLYCCHRVSTQLCKCVLYCCHRVSTKLCKCVLYCCHRVSTKLRLTKTLQYLYSTNDFLMKDLRGPKPQISRSACGWFVIVLMFHSACPHTQQRTEKRMGKWRFPSLIPGQRITNVCVCVCVRAQPVRGLL
jgi:hypothetical protein